MDFEFVLMFLLQLNLQDLIWIFELPLQQYFMYLVMLISILPASKPAHSKLLRSCAGRLWNWKSFS